MVIVLIDKEDFMRGRRIRKSVNDDVTVKIIKYASIGVGVLAVVVLGLLIYSKNLNDKVRSESLSSEQIANLLESDSESVSTEIGRSVNEASNDLQSNSLNTNSSNMMNNTTNTNANTNTSNSIQRNSITNSTNVTTNNTVNSTSNSANNSSNKDTVSNVNSNTTSDGDKKESNANEEKNQELSFSKPVEGEIMREFAKDNLIYSQTLEEWTTHTGIDIKADKTTVVKAAEAGTVKTIKNDPRYGLTIVIEHSDGFQTIYSNLLTSEFVVVGEKVEKGQSLGTVGNTAAFEIADEPHLHFEILKDSVSVDPTIYLK